MRPLENKVHYCPDGYHDSISERHMIVRDAANVIIHTELSKLVSKWKKDLDERGLDAFKEFYLVPAESVKDVENMEVGEFDTHLNCDSSSGEFDEEEEEGEEEEGEEVEGGEED